MLRLLMIALTIFSFSISATSTAVIQPENAATIWKQYLIPSAPNLDLKAYVLMDASNGEILAAKNSNTKLPPASLTKLMTLYIVFKQLSSGQIHLDDKVTINKQAWSTGGSRMFLKLGSEVAVKDLIRGVIVDSGNDATMALAEFAGGNVTSFVEMMDVQAKQLGMTNSHFSDPTGLPTADHLTTAHDLALLTRAIVTQFPQYYHFFAEKWLIWNNIRQPNRDRLLWRNIGVDGLKTGHTSEAGYCLISSGKQHDTRLIVVVLGSPTDAGRANDSQALITYGFRFFQSAQIYKANQTIDEQTVWGGKTDQVAVGLANHFSVTIPRTAYPDLKVVLHFNGDIVAPVEKHQPVGMVKVYLKNKLIASQPVVTLNAVNSAGFVGRLFDGIHHMFAGWFGKKTTDKAVIGQ